jgi:hypothetical protein
MISLNCYVDYETDYRVGDLELPSWTVLNAQIDQKRLEKELIEEHNCKLEQVKRGILRMAPKPQMLSFKSNDIGRVIVNPAVVTKLKGIDLFQPCPCGSGQDLIKCHLKEIMSKAR